MSLTHLPSRKQLLLGFFSIAIALTLLLVIGEVGMRSYAFFTREAIHPLYTINTYDAERGWRSQENFRFDGTLYDENGAPFEVSIHTQEQGFRTFARNAKNQSGKRILVLGDSYTQSLAVSNGETYPDLIQDSLPVSVYAYACEGYGTLQEYLVLEKFAELIQPDIVVLQFCTNDFVDNSLPLGRTMYGYRLHRCKPYQELSGKRIFDNQDPFAKLERYSHLGAFVARRWHELAISKGWKTNKDSSADIKAMGRDFPLYDQAVQMTGILLQQIKAQLPPQAIFLAFCADTYQPYVSDFEHLCDSLSIPVVRSIPYAIREAKFRREKVHAPDGYHWSPQGHQIVADTLIKVLRKYR